MMKEQKPFNERLEALRNEKAHIDAVLERQEKASSLMENMLFISIFVIAVCLPLTEKAVSSGPSTMHPIALFAVIAALVAVFGGLFYSLCADITLTVRNCRVHPGIKSNLLRYMFDEQDAPLDYSSIEEEELLIDLSYKDSAGPDITLTAELVGKGGQNIPFLRSLTGKSGPDTTQTLSWNIPKDGNEKIINAVRSGISLKRRFLVISLFFDSSADTWTFAIPAAGIDGRIDELSEKIRHLYQAIILAAIEQKMEKISACSWICPQEYSELHKEDIIPFFVKGGTGDIYRERAGATGAFMDVIECLPEENAWAIGQIYPGIREVS